MRNRAARRCLPILFMSLTLSLGFLLTRPASAVADKNREAVTTQATTDIVWQGLHTNVVRSVAFSTDGQQVASGGDDRSAKLWQASNGALLQTHLQCSGLSCGSVGQVSFSPDGQTWAATGRGIKFWSVADGTLLRTLNISTGPLTLSPDWQYVAASVDNSAYAANLPSTVTLFRASDGGQVWQANGGGLEVAFSPDGQTIAAVGRKTGIDLWRISDGTHLRNIPGPKHALIFSSDGQYLISTQAAQGLYPFDDTIEMYRVSDGALVQTLLGTGAITSMALTPDGQTLISTGWEWDQDSVTQVGVIRFWRLSDGALLKTYDQGTGTYTAGLAVSPDGNFFSYSSEKSVVVARIPSFACAFKIDHARATYQHQGGDGVVQVTAPEGCSWTAYSRANWVHITSGSSGTGNGTVTYSVDTGPCTTEGPTGLYRDGILVIAEQTYDVNQNECPLGPGHYLIYGQVNDGGSCGVGLPGVAVTLSGYASASTETNAYGEFSFDAQVGQQSYTITASKTGYAFSPQSKTIDKLTYDSAVIFSATTNPYPRHYVVGHVTDSKGQPLTGVTLHLEGAAPYPQQTYSDSNGFYGFTCLAYGGTFTITPEYSGYSFTPSNQVAKNLSANETMNFTGVSNAPPVCTYSINLTSQLMTANGGAGNIALTTSAGCAWKARYTADWLKLSDSDGAGGANISYSVQPNTSIHQRSTSVDIAGQLFTLTQEGAASCAYAISPASNDFGVEGGTGSVTVTSEAGCAWTASSDADWITINSGGSGNGNGGVSYTVAPNAGASRTGTLTIAGQTFTVGQKGALILTGKPKTSDSIRQPSSRPRSFDK